MRSLYTRLGVYIVSLAISLALVGCGGIEVGAPPPLGLDIASVTPMAGPAYNAARGEIYTAQAIANKDYAAAEGKVTGPGSLFAFDTNPRMNSGELYKPSMTMQVEFRPYDSGVYRSIFTFFGLTESKTRTTDFNVFTYNARSARGVVADPITEPGPTTDACYNNDCGTPDPLPIGYHLRYIPLPHRSAEPFLNFTNESDGRVTRADLERRAATWSQETRDHMSAFFSVVYEDELWRLSGSRPASGDLEGHSEMLRAAARALDAREPRTDGAQWVDVAEPVIARLAQALSAESFLPTTGNQYQTETAFRNTSAISGEEGASSVYPNPATTSLTVRTSAGADAITVIDLLGRRVARLTPSAGLTTWSLRDDAGRRVPAGLYVVQIENGSERFTHRVTVY